MRQKSEPPLEPSDLAPVKIHDVRSLNDLADTSDLPPVKIHVRSLNDLADTSDLPPVKIHVRSLNDLADTSDLPPVKIHVRSLNDLADTSDLAPLKIHARSLDLADTNQYLPLSSELPEPPRKKTKLNKQRRNAVQGVNRQTDQETLDAQAKLALNKKFDDVMAYINAGLNYYEFSIDDIDLLAVDDEVLAGIYNENEVLGGLIVFKRELLTTKSTITLKILDKIDAGIMALLKTAQVDSNPKTTSTDDAKKQTTATPPVLNNEPNQKPQQSAAPAQQLPPVIIPPADGGAASKPTPDNADSKPVDDVAAKRKQALEDFKTRYANNLKALETEANQENKYRGMLHLLQHYVDENHGNKDLKKQVIALIHSLNKMDNIQTKNKVAYDTLQLLLDANPSKEAIEKYKAFGAQILKSQPQSKSAQAICGCMLAIGAILLTLGALILAGTLVAAPVVGIAVVAASAAVLISGGAGLFSIRSTNGRANADAKDLNNKIDAVASARLAG